MAINKKLIFFKKKLHYNTEISNGLPNTSISFIADTKEIITHGTIFAGIDNVKSVLPTGNAGLELGLLWHEIPPGIYDSVLTEDGTYIVLVIWGKAIYTGIFPYKNLHVDNVSYANDGVTPKINTDEEIVLTCCGYIPETRGRLYLKLAAGNRTTQETVAGVQKAVITKPSLFIAVSKTSDLELDGLTFKFRRLI